MNNTREQELKTVIEKFLSPEETGKLIEELIELERVTVPTGAWDSYSILDIDVYVIVRCFLRELFGEEEDVNDEESYFLTAEMIPELMETVYLPAYFETEAFSLPQ